MVRKQNERTVLLQSRIIPLSLHSIFHILAPPRPLSSRLGAFLYPETFSHKFFPKFFPIRPRRLFSVFLVRKIMRMKGTCRFPNRGGVPCCLLPYIAGLLPCIPFCPLCFPFASSCLSSGQKASETGQNGAKVKLYLPAFVFSREFERPKEVKCKDIFEKVVQDVWQVVCCLPAFFVSIGAGGAGLLLLFC